MNSSLIKMYAPDVYNTYEYNIDEEPEFDTAYKIFLEKLYGNVVMLLINIFIKRRNI
jgi:hypothetical protein